MLEFKDNNLEKALVTSHLPILVDFWASWCLPCKALEPVLKAFAIENAKKLLVGRINVDLNPTTVYKYNILGLPTLILFYNGSEIARSLSTLSRNQLRKFVKEELNKKINQKRLSD